MSSGTGLHLGIDMTTLRPLLVAVVREVIEQLQHERQRLGDSDCLPMSTWAKRLGLGRHVLRDARQRGELAEGRRVGRQIMLTREEIEAFMNR